VAPLVPTSKFRGAEPLAHRAIAFLGRPFMHWENKLSLLELRISLARHTGDPAAALTAARVAVEEPTLADRPRYGCPCSPSRPRPPRSRGDRRG
jgi:hypothetical protein